MLKRKPKFVFAFNDFSFNDEGSEPDLSNHPSCSSPSSKESRSSSRNSLSQREFLACIADALDDLQRAAAAKGYDKLTELLRAAHVQALIDGYQRRQT